jgi:hypothetical protein
MVREFADRFRSASLMRQGSRYAAALVLVVCLTLASGCAQATKARPRPAASRHSTATPTTPTTQQGEIKLDGVVRSINTKERSLVLVAQKATLPGGNPAELSPARDKTVTIGNLTILSTNGGAGRKLDLSSMRIGETISVIGKNLGAGKPLPARVIMTKTLVAEDRGPAQRGRKKVVVRTPPTRPVVAKKYAAADPPSDLRTSVPAATSTSDSIEITDSAWQHITDRHTVGGAKSSGASIFNQGEDIRALIKMAEGISPVLEANGYLKREFDAGHIIGTDPATGRQTSTCRVIATQSGKLVTAYPVAH